MKEKLFDFAAQKLNETDKAVRLSDGIKTAWFPKSQLKDNKDGTFTVPEWLAIEKEFV